MTSAARPGPGRGVRLFHAVRLWLGRTLSAPGGGEGRSGANPPPSDGLAARAACQVTGWASGSA